MKKLLIPITALLVLAGFLHADAQITGRSSNSQNPGKEVKTEGITSGSLSNDVNLFTGTLNTSYSLGTVHTLSGLSFTANLSYNSSFSSGDNMPHLSGVPYGEGWGLDVPMISISTEDYNQYTPQQLENMANNQQAGSGNTEKTPTFINYADNTCDKAKEEGRLYWFAPTVNIPGVGGGRMVYQSKVGDEYIFVPNRFEKYMEARLNMTNLQWRVITDDGTIYTFKHLTIQHRNPSNQRIQYDCQTDKDALKNLILPKSEITTWYCDNIAHPNHVDQIKFEYQTYGKFNFMKVFKDSWINRIFTFFNISGTSLLEPPAKDVFITRIYTLSDELKLNYSTIANTGGVNLPDATFTDVPGDNLYAQKEIYNSSTNTFNNWRRYNHIRSDETSLSCSRNTDIPLSPGLNPFVADASPVFFSPANGLLSYKVMSGSSSTLLFKHGFLESPKIMTNTLIPGDLYEVSYRVTNSGTTLFDVNIATGDNTAGFTGAEVSMNSNTLVKFDCYNKYKGESVFSTFNQAVKWDPYDGATIMSNYFNMPNLPNTHNGIYLQVGPANSDIDISKGSGSVPNDLTALGTEPTPNICNAYFNNIIGGGNQEQTTDNNGTSQFKSGNAVPNNFGIGQPWFMLQRRQANGTSSFYGSSFDCSSNNNRYWWNDKKNESGVTLNACSPNVSWGNSPTTAPSASLEYAKLTRYAKKPYMLTSVEYKVKNDAQTMVTVQKLTLDYSIQQIDCYAAAYYDQSMATAAQQNLTFLTGRKRNLVLLQSISQVPTDNTTLTTAQTPVTKFTYSEFNPVSTAQFSPTISTWSWGIGQYPLNGNTYILTKIVDPLGKTTEIEYYPLSKQTDPAFLTLNVNANALSYMAVNFQYRLRPSEFKAKYQTDDCNCTYTTGYPSNNVAGNPMPNNPLPPGGDVRMGKSYTYQTYLVVKTKSEYDRDAQVRRWSYTFDGITYNYDVDRPAFSAQFIYDYSNNTVKAGFKTAIVTGPYYGTTVGGPVTTYRHHANKLYWGKPYEIEAKTASSGTVVTRKRLLYQNVLAYDRLWTAQSPVLHPDFPNLTGNVTFDMPRFYETRYATAINTANSDYLKSYFVKLVSDSLTTYETGGNYTTVNQYSYYDAYIENSTLKSNCEGYKILLNATALPVTLNINFAPSWQLFSTKTFSTDYTGTNELYTKTENYYLYDLIQNTAYQSGNAVNTNFKNLVFIRDKQMRNVAFQSRTINKQSFTDGAKQQSVNTIYQKFFETSGDALTGKLLPTATWVQMDTVTTSAVMSFQSANNFRAVVGWKYLLMDSIQTYSQYNLAPRTTVNVLGLLTTNTYNQYTGLPTQQEVGTGLSDNLTTTFTYNSDNTLSSANYPNNLSYTYNYDKLKRPTLQKRNNVELQRTVYSQFNSVASTHTFQQRMALNYVRTSTFITDADSILTYTYFDPLGRTTGVVEDGTLKANTHYDVFDRTIYSRRPYTASTPTTVMPTTGIAADYLQTQYDAAPRSRPLKSAKYGQDVTSASAKVVQSQYAIITAATFTNLLTQAGLSVSTPVGTNFIQETVIDEDSKTTRVISNFFGQKLAEITGSGIAATAYYYNADGKVLKVINPKGQASTYRYNYLGQLFQKRTPDEGTVTYAYNKAGQVIIDINGLNETRAYKYDIYGRMLMQKYIASSGSLLYYNEGMAWRDANEMTLYEGYFTDAAVPLEKQWFYNSYNSGASNLFASETSTLLNNGGQTNTKGRLAQINSYNLAGVPVNIQLLSYTNDGFMNWEVQQFNEAGITSTAKGLTTKIDYPTYNRAGSLIKENIDLSYDGVLDMQYYRTYDKRNRLTNVYVSYTDVGASGRKIVSYTYNDATNLITQKRFYDRLADGTCERQVDAVDYTYDSRYRLTRMNSYTLDYQLTYDANQPSVAYTNNLTSTNYNGNINSVYANYKSLFSGVTNFTGGTVYTYRYDNLNRLTVADARIGRTASLTALTANQLLYGDNTFSYDLIGNISTTSIWLMNSGNTASEQYGYAYSYAAGKNALTTINKINGSNTGLDRTLTTDNAGRLTGDTKKSLASVIYRPSGLVWEHTFSSTNTPKTKYLYDAADRRIYKEQTTGTSTITTVSKEYYLYDALGHEIYIRDMMPNATQDKHTWYVNGKEREARFPDARTTAGGSGLTGDNGNEWYRSNATRSDAWELPYPNRLYLVTRTDTAGLPLGYLLETELPERRNGITQIQTISINRPEDRFVVTDSSGHNPRLLDVQEILELRTSGERFWLEGYSTDCTNAEAPAAALLPPPSVIDPRFYIYDHLGNTRVVFNSNVPTNCGTTTFSLEYAADYSPYGRLLRSYTASGARERFLTTGHERDPETGYDNRGARLYDAEIGRFLTVDPLAAKFTGWSTYCYVLGNPVKFVDPDGKEPVPVSSKQFRQFANNLGLSGNQQIGSFFERLTMASLQTTSPVVHNTSMDFYSPARNRMNLGLPASVRPDGISTYLGASHKGEVFVSPSFYEAKATSATISKKYRQAQITGMIDVLANMDMRPNEMASLTLVTTSDTKISTEILEYATSRKVVLFQSVAAIDDETGEFILSEKTLLNGNAISTIIDKARKLNGSYDEYKGVNPTNYVNGRGAGSGDPDPATIDDK